MKVVPSLPHANTLNHVGEMFNTLLNPQALKYFGKAIAKDLPKTAIQQSTKQVQKAWDATAESVSKHLRAALLPKNSGPVVVHKTDEEIEQQKKEIETLNSNFKTTMSRIGQLRAFYQPQDQTQEQVLEHLEDIHKQLDQLTPKKPITLGEVLTKPAAPLVETIEESEITEEQLSTAEQIEALAKQIATQLDELLPLKENVFTHKVAHSAAPSWLALLLDSTYEPNYIEKLATLITTLKDKGTEGITDKFIEEAEKYTEKPLDTLASDTTFKNIPDTSAYMLADAASMFLGVLSVVRGNQERREANHEIKHLHKERNQLKHKKNNITILNQVLDGNLPTGLRFNELLNTAKLDRNKRGLQAAKLDKQIAISAIGAGSSSALKGLSDITVKTGLAIKSFVTGHGLLGGAAVASKGSAAGIAATASGAASTIALGPLAGLFAVGLGAGFLRKTGLKLNQLKKDFSASTTQLDNLNRLVIQHLPDETQKNTFNTYKTFIEEQGAKRIQFFSRFKTWNKAFLVGAGLYTASSAAKAGIVVASLLGATAVASNPVGWGVLTGVGIAAAIGLGISTLGFIKGHVRQTRYNQQTAGDHALVDRHFLVNAQNFSRSAPAGDASNSTHDGSSAAKEGVLLAASNLEMLNTRANQIKAFLKQAAEGTESIAPFSDKLNVLQRLRGKTLGKTKFNEFLGQTGQFKSLISDFVLKDLEQQSQHIQRKLDFRTAHQGEHLLTGEQIETLAKSDQAPQALAAYQSHLTHMENKAIMDAKRLKQVSSLKNDLEQLIGENSDEITPQEQTQIKTRLLQHWGVKVVDKQGNALGEAKIHTLFAKHMVYTQRKDVDMAKGVLFEAQLQAQHMNSLA